MTIVFVFICLAKCFLSFTPLLTCDKFRILSRILLAHCELLARLLPCFVPPIHVIGYFETC